MPLPPAEGDHSLCGVENVSRDSLGLMGVVMLTGRVMECLMTRRIVLQVSERREGSSLDLNLLLSAQGSAESWPLCTSVSLPVKLQ